jgi:tetratricopeptide (TPR) repeat protein
VKVNQRGILVSKFRLNLEFQRSGLAPLFHEAVGLLKELDAVERFIRDGGYTFNPPSQFAEISGTAHGLIAAHLGMLRLRCATAATSLILFADNGARSLASSAKKDVRDVIGGPKVNDVTLLEGLRAAGDWARHHYTWTSADDNWPVTKLLNLGLSIGDPVLPARIFALYGFESYVGFERALLDAVRALTFEWWGGEDEGWIVASPDYWKEVMAGTKDLVADVVVASNEPASVEDLVKQAVLASESGNLAIAEALFQKALDAPDVTPRKATFLHFNRAVTLDKMRRFERAIVSYSRATERAEPFSDLQAHAAHSMFQQAVDVHRARGVEPALTAYGELVTRFSASSGDDTLQWVVRAQINQAMILEDENHDDAIRLYDWVIDRFRATNDADLRYHVARALKLKSDILWNAGNRDSARSSYRCFVSYSFDNLTPPTREVFSEALAMAQQRIALSD